MKAKSKVVKYVADFETVVYGEEEIEKYGPQTSTEVWGVSLVKMWTEKVHIMHSFEELFNYLITRPHDTICYFHNLKFDGSFWLNYLVKNEKFKPAYIRNDRNEVIGWCKEKEMLPYTFKYVISQMGQWYSIIINTGRHMLEIRDSLKLLPFSVKQLGEAFKTKHRKLEMNYEGLRFAGCVITDEEEEYMKNDVLVVKEALEIMESEGHDMLTIGSCCMQEFKSFYDKDIYKMMFPDLTKIELKPEIYGSTNVDEYIRKSYKGGWCYVVEGKEQKVYRNGLVADVNSLYPSEMHSDSGNPYPFGQPSFWVGTIPDICWNNDKYFFVRIRTKFKIKDGYLPFIQIKKNLRYRGNEMLKTSDIYDKEQKKYISSYIDKDGNKQEVIVELTLTKTDYILLKEHYDLECTEILDGCYFNARVGLFDEYINKYAEIKKNSKGAIRTLAKLFLNNLYGKFATSTDSSFKTAYVKDTGSIGFKTVHQEEKDAGYIAIGSAVTSYARNFTIRHAQMNYYGVDKRGFIYADTDSIHCDLKPEELVGIKVHPSNFECWKLENYWDVATFIRQKTYIEHVTHEDCEELEQPFYQIKCAGLPPRCKELLSDSLEGKYSDMSTDELKEVLPDYYDDELEFVHVKRTMSDFKPGIIVPSKLMPKQIQGGTLLVRTNYEMRQ